MPKDQDVVLCCKIVVLGDSGVGKTSLANRWINGAWTDSVKPTIGANHQRKRVVIDGQNLDVFMWDTAGQEQFRSLAPVYTRSSSAVVVVVSIVEQSSFQTIGDWVDIVRATSEKMPPVILCVNKIDLPGHCQQFEEVVEKHKGDFAGIFFVSALTGQEVDNAFRCAAENAYKFVTENQQVESKKIDADSNKSGCC